MLLIITQTDLKTQIYLSANIHNMYYMHHTLQVLSRSALRRSDWCEKKSFYRAIILSSVKQSVDEHQARLTLSTFVAEPSYSSQRENRAVYFSGALNLAAGLRRKAATHQLTQLLAPVISMWLFCQSVDLTNRGWRKCLKLVARSRKEDRIKNEINSRGDSKKTRLSSGEFFQELVCSSKVVATVATVVASN